MTNRTITDASLKVTTALPAAAANADSTSIDLGSVEIFPTNEFIDVKLSVPALPSLVDDKTVTFTFQDSADDSTFAAISELATLVVTGAGGAGAAATSTVVKLPGNTKRYINVNAAVLTAGGDNTGVSYTLEVLS